MTGTYTTGRGVRLAAFAVMLLPALGASWQARAAGGDNGMTVGGGTWNTDTTSLTPPSNAMMPSYDGLSAAGSQDAFGSDAASGTQVQVHQDNPTGTSGYSQTLSVFSPGSNTKTTQSGFFIDNHDHGEDSNASVSYNFDTPQNYFGALVNFSGMPFGDISLDDANYNTLVEIDPMSQAYQTNTDSAGNTVYSLYLNVTSDVGISYVSFAAVNADYNPGNTQYMTITQQYQAVNDATGGGGGGGGTSDVPEPGLMAVGSLIGLAGIAMNRRRTTNTAA